MSALRVVVLLALAVLLPSGVLASELGALSPEAACTERGRPADAAAESALHAELSPTYKAWLRGGVSGGLAFAGSDVVLGAGVAAEGTVGLLQPLHLHGAARWLPGEGLASLDALAGLTLRSYGTEYIRAGASAVGGTVVTWRGNCQVRRSDWSLVAGTKFYRAPGVPAKGSPGIFALQAGLHRVLGSTSKLPMTNWSLTGLYDPIGGGYGGQFTLGAQGLLIAFPGPDWFWTGVTVGGLVGPNYANNSFWFTFDLGLGHIL